MADTQRTLSELQALLADNTTGNISPQDLRDFLVTMHPSVGASYISSASATTISAVNTYTNVAGTFTSVAANRFTVGSDGTLTYTGAAATTAFVLCAASITSAGNSKVFTFAIAKNGAEETSSEIQRKTGTGADVGALALFAIINIVQGDVLQLRVQNTTDDTDVTFQKCFLMAYATMS